MIKFFRQIRQKLLTENQFSKYLIYAIGEIVLVVIGILIALQINTWNEARKERNIEQKLLLEYQAELNYNYEALVFSNKTMVRRAKMCALLLKYIENKLPYSDTLSTRFGVLSFGLGESNLSKTAFNAIEAKGFDYIGNDSLKNRITFLHSYRYNKLDHRIENLMLNIRDYGRPIIRTKLKSTEENKHLPLDYKDLMSDVTLWNTLKILQSNYEDLSKVIQDTQDEIKEVDGLIDQYLNVT